MVGKTKLRQAVSGVKDRVETLRTRFGEYQDRALDRLSVRQARIGAWATIGVSSLSMPAAAQSVGELGSAMCGSGVGQLIGFAAIAAAMYYLIKAVFKSMSALDKMESTSQQNARQGKNELASAGRTGAAAFVPAVAAGVFEVMGISTVSCLDPSQWSIVGTLALVPF